MPIALIVHGGAGLINPERADLAQAGCKEAALAGWQILQAGGSALDAVEAAVRSLEDNPNYNAGTGACLTSDGRIELDAGLMDGHTLDVGAIAGIELIKNPISLARKVLESAHVLLVSKGAQQFAQEHGISQCTIQGLMTERQYKRWLTEHSNPQGQEKHGTVGAVALDQSGRLAAATSTGGMPNKHPGRVGDSPLVGCGFYADENAAISCTGDGEDFTRLLIAKRAADFVVQGLHTTPPSQNAAQAAAEAAIAVLGARASGVGGLIVVDRLGHVGFAWNSQHLARAYILEGIE